MSRRRSPPSPPKPQVGDFLLVTHGILYEPQHWWIAPVEWTDGAHYLVRATASWARQREPTLLSPAAFAFFGSEAACEDLRRAAHDLYLARIPAIRDAQVALDKVKTGLSEDVSNLVAAASISLEAAA